MDGNVERNFHNDIKSTSLFIFCHTFVFSLGDVVILTSMCVSYPSEIEHELYKVNYINIDI